jgi:hypothetical protein
VAEGGHPHCAPVPLIIDGDVLPHPIGLRSGIRPWSRCSADLFVATGPKEVCSGGRAQWLALLYEGASKADE